MEFPADDQAVIARLLAYLYTGNVIGANTKYEESVISRGQFAGLVDPYKKCDFVKELELYIKMYCVAEKYLLPQLKDLALGHYCEKLQKWTQDIQSRNQHVTSTIFGSDLIPLVYEAELPDSDRDLKDPLLVLIHSDIRDTKHVNRYEHRHMLARAPSEFLFDLMMRPLKDYVLICEKCKEDVCVLDEYCICGMAGCNAQHCWPDEMKLVQCYLCGRRCFTRDGADID